MRFGRKQTPARSAERRDAREQVNKPVRGLRRGVPPSLTQQQLAGCSRAGPAVARSKAESKGAQDAMFVCCMDSCFIGLSAARSCTCARRFRRRRDSHPRTRAALRHPPRMASVPIHFSAPPQDATAAFGDVRERDLRRAGAPGRAPSRPPWQRTSRRRQAPGCSPLLPSRGAAGAGPRAPRQARTGPTTAQGPAARGWGSAQPRVGAPFAVVAAAAQRGSAPGFVHRRGSGESFRTCRRSNTETEVPAAA